MLFRSLLVFSFCCSQVFVTSAMSQSSGRVRAPQSLVNTDFKLITEQHIKDIVNYSRTHGFFTVRTGTNAENYDNQGNAIMALLGSLTGRSPDRIEDFYYGSTKCGNSNPDFCRGLYVGDEGGKKIIYISENSKDKKKAYIKVTLNEQGQVESVQKDISDTIATGGGTFVSTSYGEAIGRVNRARFEQGDANKAFEAEKAAGLAEGIARGKAEGLTEGKAEGLTEGKAEGLAEGISQGLTQGKQQGLDEGTKIGKKEGLKQGLLIGAGVAVVGVATYAVVKKVQNDRKKKAEILRQQQMMAYGVPGFAPSMGLGLPVAQAYRPMQTTNLGIMPGGMLPMGSM